MQCLYCETELKGLRSFFDEDFCCREHRDKYLSSFRKGWDQLPDHQYTAAEIAVADGDDGGAAPQTAVSTLEPEPTPQRVTYDDPEVFVRVFQLVSEAAGETELTATRLAEFMPMNLEASDISATPHWTGLPLATFTQPSQTAGQADIGWSTTAPSAEDQPQSERVYAESGRVHPTAGQCEIETRLQLGLPVLVDSSHGAVLPVSLDYCELFLDGHSLDSHPVAALQMAPVLPIELPSFAAAHEALEIEAEGRADAAPLSEDERQADVAIAGDLLPQTAPVHRDPIPEMAPPMGFHSSGVGAMSLRASEDSNEKAKSALVPQPSALALPGFASILEPVAPAAPAEMISGASLEPAPPDAAAPGAEKDAGKPLRLTFGSLVRIKNWKLRITFARSA